MSVAATRKAAIDAFNQAWEMIEKPRRTPAEDDAMIAAAERSLALWAGVGGPVNDQRGEWMIARTAVAAGRKEKALAHAQRTLALTRAALSDPTGFEDFDFAFAEEIAARAHGLSGDLDRARRHYEEAKRLGDAIADDGERAEFFRQFAIGPWYGLESEG